MSREKYQIGKIFGIGDRIRQVREKLGLNQENFAKKLGFSQAAVVSKYEKGRIPGKDVLDKIALMGQVSVEWLLHGSNTAEEPGEELSVCPAHINIELLGQIVAAVQRRLAKHKRTLPPERFGLLVSLLYDHFWESGEEVLDYIVDRYLMLA